MELTDIRSGARVRYIGPAKTCEDGTALAPGAIGEIHSIHGVDRAFSVRMESGGGMWIPTYFGPWMDRWEAAPLTLLAVE